MGDSYPAQEGDIVILQKRNCNALSTSAVRLPRGRSDRLVLASGGRLSMNALIISRVNELDYGPYRICLASKESLGDSDSDFASTTASTSIYEDNPHVVLQTPVVVSLGQDITLNWSISGRRVRFNPNNNDISR